MQRQVNISETCNLPMQVSPETVQVILSGPLPILQTLQRQDVEIVVAPPRCESGAYQADLRAINIPDKISVERIVPATAEVNVQDGLPNSGMNEALQTRFRQQDQRAENGFVPFRDWLALAFVSLLPFIFYWRAALGAGMFYFGDIARFFSRRVCCMPTRCARDDYRYGSPKF